MFGISGTKFVLSGTRKSEFLFVSFGTQICLFRNPVDNFSHTEQWLGGDFEAGNNTT